MAKDYFQDITPPAGGSTAPRPPSSPPPSPEPLAREMSTAMPEPPERSIRNINITPGRRPARSSEDIRETGAPIPPSPREPRRVSRFGLWGAVVIALLVLGAIALVALRPTSVTVTPRSHIVLFDETAQFTAYPAQATTTTNGTLLFTIETSTFEDSQVVPAQGVERVEDKASGTITVYNDYSTAPQKLVKNTRFQTPEGLVFRAPAEVIIPGRSATTPGQVFITVIADKAGEEYNVGTVEKFTLPGLKSTPLMYAKIYARSSAPMTGGFVGERPAASPAALEAARAQIRARLQEKVVAFSQTHTDADSFAFSDLARVTFEALPSTVEREGEARIHERARVELPVFPADMFAHIVGESVSASSENGALLLKPGADFSARPLSTAVGSLSEAPLSFTLEGTAQLVWRVDVGELAAALAGRDETAFQAIVETFPGIEEAHARIEPFWKNSFPSDPSAIKIKVQEPAFTN